MARSRPARGISYIQWSEESVRSVITTIEEWIIQSLSLFGVSGLRDKSMQGVWFNNHKVASIGLAFSKWVSRHGFDINLDTPDGRIESVEGCGLPLGKHTSLAKFGYKQDLKRSMRRFSSFAVAFSLISILTGIFANFHFGFLHYKQL